MTEKTKNAMINFFNVYPVGAKISEYIDKVAKNFGISVTTLKKYAAIEYIEDYEYIEITKKNTRRRKITGRRVHMTMITALRRNGDTLKKMVNITELKLKNITG